MRFLQFPTITVVTLGCFLISCVPSQNLASTPTGSPTPTTLTVTIESPKQGETIKEPAFDMRGKYVGEIPNGYKLWVLIKDQYNYFMAYPPPSVAIPTKSWSQRNVRLGSLGSWELHVCLANKAASQWLEDRAKKGIWAGFPSLPEGIKTVKYIKVNRI